MNNLTWHCELVLKNDEECAGVCDCLVTHVMNRVYHDYEGRPYMNQKNARIYILSEFLKNYIEEITDAGNEYNRRDPMACELLCGALQEVNFREIAEALIDDHQRNLSPAEIADNEEYFNIMGFSNYDIDED